MILSLIKTSRKGAMFVEYAMALAFVMVVGVCFLGNSSIKESIGSIFVNTENILDLAIKGTPEKPKYNIADDAAPYADVISVVLSSLENAPALTGDEKLGWTTLNGSGLNKLFTYTGKGLGTAEFAVDATNKQNFNSLFMDSVSSTNYKISEGYVFYDTDGKLVYNNPVGGTSRIGGQGAYNYFKLTDRNDSKDVKYIYYGSDSAWHYSETKPSNKNLMPY